MNDLTIQRGNPYSASITISNKTVTPAIPYDLTGKTVFFTLKRINDESADDTAALIYKNITAHSNPSGGITELNLTSTETNQVLGRYKCDFRIYNAGGVQFNSVTFYAQIVDIVTKRIA